MVSFKVYPTGSANWGLLLYVGNDTVQAAITGPFGGKTDGDFMTPEQADEIGLGFIHAAQAARDEKKRVDERLAELAVERTTA